jgi:DNA recombination protein RmuC
MLNVLVGLGIGVLLGAALGWLWGARRREGGTSIAPDLQPLVAELRQQLSAREAVAEKAQAELAESKSQLAATQATQRALERSAQEQRAEHERVLSAAREAQSGAEQQLAAARAELAQEKALHAATAARLGEMEKSLADFREASRQQEATAASLREQLVASEKARSDLDAKVTFLNERLTSERAELEKVHERFRKEFEAISNRLLVENANHFKQQSSENLEKLLTPLRDNLKDFKERLEKAHQESASHTAVLKDQIARIGSEAANLARALKGDVKVLGNWGEHRLDLLLEKSGLQLGLHYERQHSATDVEAEKQRYLDVLVKLPEGKHLVIDSKVSLTCYEAHINATEDGLRLLHLEKHIECIRKHVKDLAGKRYQDLYGIQAPDFVLMYIPLESAFFAAVAHEPDLFAEALDRNVVLITNSTLLATLRTVAHVWRLAAQQENATEIARRGGQLYDKFVGFIEDLDGIGKALASGQKQYDEAVKKLHAGRGNLVRQVEELKTLGAKATKSLPAPLLDKARESEDGAVLLN